MATLEEFTGQLRNISNQREAAATAAHNEALYERALYFLLEAPAVALAEELPTGFVREVLGNGPPDGNDLAIGRRYVERAKGRSRRLSYPGCVAPVHAASTYWDEED